MLFFKYKHHFLWVIKIVFFCNANGFISRSSYNHLTAGTLRHSVGRTKKKKKKVEGKNATKGLSTVSPVWGMQRSAGRTSSLFLKFYCSDTVLLLSNKYIPFIKI